MNSDEIRRRFIAFFKEQHHTVLPSASLITSDDDSVTGKTLFVSAGMQPLVKYLLGHPHPEGKRLVSVQKCVRTQDIDEVGDNTHDTFFEMLGNWSLGDYFKEEAIKWSFELLTDKKKGFGLDPKRLYITVFEGDENAPRDNEAFEIWKKYIPENRIYFMSAKSNWWSAGENGPCGPDTEMFYDITGTLGDMTKKEYMKADDEQTVVEIWNDVFMEYEKKDGKVIGKLANKNVDTGAGLERLAMVLQNKNNIFDTDLFKKIMDRINEVSPNGSIRSKRIVADHVRTAVFMIADGVTPSNTDRGYILRRIIRGAVWHGYKIGFDKVGDGGHLSLLDLIKHAVSPYENTYKNFRDEAILTKIKKEIYEEDLRFMQTLKKGEDKLRKLMSKGPISGEDAFILYSTFGFPFELTREIVRTLEVNVTETVQVSDFIEKMKVHKDLSRAGAEQKFKGGLADHNEKTIRLHTAHHLLLAGLQAIVSPTIKQRGSNITEERLRIDFLCDHKLTDDEKNKVEAWVNDKIQRGLNVVRREMPLVEAEKIGAEMEFSAKYPDVVSVYFIEDENGNPISKEFCGGPHVSNTSELGTFKIIKEEAVSAGVRRIKAVLVEN
jgi:alanyl-tRNA synthetase